MVPDEAERPPSVVLAECEDNEDWETALQNLPTFGSIAVTNSSDIHFGNKTVYQGPVTIKQLVYANAKVPIGDEEKNLPEIQKGLPSSKGTQEVERRDALKECAGALCRRRRCLALCLSLTGALVVTAVLLTVLLGHRSEDAAASKSAWELIYNRPTEIYNTTLSGKLRILPRKEWLAQPSNTPVAILELPLPYVIISHTATEPCFKQAECVHSVRLIQTFHIESKGWSDIAYNFLVGGDGYVYTGRGWDRQGAHTYGYNLCGLGISLIGTFIQEHPTDIQLLAMKQLIEEGVRLGKLRSDYKLLGHRQLSKTESPGQFLFNDIKVSPHWLRNPVPCKSVHQLFEQEDAYHNDSITTPSH